uniref:ATP synthase complex subunit 8 n=2 Tax=Callantra TaxID=87118 RepID=A0A4Y5QTV1_9MUSC|nr:ATP synthase F0 subunit 8 [Dacus longicornis]YP_009672536.1 ATP synthase F0 subunit 8 [Dacus conopsoides]APL97146.1 ATP synthase F0 subunit 8 [Dacus longicornis]QCX42559.1 ATP synthase F0 subunit 8 [Dacus conopsoides]WCB98297.1 ATP synthase F0 subunit 8 [Dacus longicornis]
MPQMAPIAWLSLFIIFSTIFILFNTMNYYSTTPQTPKSLVLQKYSTSPFNWKW